MAWRSIAMAAFLLSAPLQAAQQTPPEPSAAERMRAAEQALENVDPERMSDPAYAGTIADHLLLLRTRPGLDAETRYRTEQMLAFALAHAGRHDAAAAAAEAMIRIRPAAARSYLSAWSAASIAERREQMISAVERAAEALRDPAERAAFAADFERGRVAWQLRGLEADRDGQGRFAAALLRLGWPGAGEPRQMADALRLIVVDRHLRRGERAEAARIAGEVLGVRESLILVTGRRFDTVIGEADRVGRVRAAIEAKDRATAGALAAAPDEIDALVERATFLRATGRDRQALELLLPLMGDPTLVVARGERALWLVNEAAYSLIATGEPDEAIELMRPVAAIDLEANPGLVNTTLNYIHMLFKTGRNEEVLREAARVEAATEGYASDYGKMVLWGNAVCAAAALERSAESDRWLRPMEAKAGENPSSMIQARLCRGETDAAESLLVNTLENDDWREEAILWMQDWEPRQETVASQLLAGRFAELRARPAVEAAFARVGRRLRLPLPSTFYGF